MNNNRSRQGKRKKYRVNCSFIVRTKNDLPLDLAFLIKSSLNDNEWFVFDLKEEVALLGEETGVDCLNCLNISQYSEKLSVNTHLDFCCSKGKKLFPQSCDDLQDCNVV